LWHEMCLAKEDKKRFLFRRGKPLDCFLCMVKKAP
jgi:hypothetical protein